MNGRTSSRDEEKEKPWTDARIRLIGDYSTAGFDDDDDDDDNDTVEEEDLDQERDSLETLSFRFPHPDDDGCHDNSDDDNKRNKNKPICIELEGYSMDSGKVWSSTGLTIWRASGVLCDYILKNHMDWKKRKRILELGAGLGLCGILIHRTTPASTYVCLTDGDTDTLKQLRTNIQRNYLPNNDNNDVDDVDVDFEVNKSTNAIIACHQLLWGRDDALAFLDKQCCQTFDVLLGSDIIYAECIIQSLWETVQILLTKPTGIFIMAFSSGRQVGPIDAVLDVATQSGFTYTCVVAEDDSRKCAQDEGVSIYVFKWNDPSL